MLLRLIKFRVNRKLALFLTTPLRYYYTLTMVTILAVQ
jgi:hypothetical protein